MTPRASRLLRGTLLGGVATLLAAVSHLVGGGPAPTGIALVLGGVFAGAVGTIAVGRIVAGRRVGLVRTITAVTISQLAFHLVFSLLGSGATVTASGGHHHELFALVSDPAAAVAQGGAAMWLAHLVAGALTVGYLRGLESRVWAVLARVGGFLLRVLGIRTPRPANRRPRPVAGRRDIPVSETLRTAISRRGPPLASRV
ncbi:hypothetical protein [Protaetiibacter mangrovi]|uniref:MFS transporter n=1 Tax=Protaetiibacter mangrovi TaxID=2970926 RepID=A0ABT1ZEK6_9MICO|nr:hypothetical protein [Protaetiibacter mangrovi]MCS0499130.1 hypothetical protein [Protaetiibacter mangrovi]